MDKVLQTTAVALRKLIISIREASERFGQQLKLKWQQREKGNSTGQKEEKQVSLKKDVEATVTGKDLMDDQMKKSAPTGQPAIRIASEHEQAQTKERPEKVTHTESAFQNTEELENPNYQLPSTELLTTIPKTDQSQEYKTIQKNTKILQQTLTSFGVKATVKSVNLGPSVTEYELHPDIGVKVSKIVGLSDDIALALAAKDIRIEAPIPGKSLIGIEVPNTEVSTVSFRDVVEAQTEHPDAILQVPIGRDVSGNLVLADLVKMQHLLIAGATGSGKSVMINVIITSLLMNARPDQVKFILIDPKKLSWVFIKIFRIFDASGH